MSTYTHFTLAAVPAAPEAFADAAGRYTGDSHIIDPQGEILAGPAEGEQILLVDGSDEHVYAAKTQCDVTGHWVLAGFLPTFGGPNAPPAGGVPGEPYRCDAQSRGDGRTGECGGGPGENQWNR